MVYHSLIPTVFWHTSPFFGMKPFVTVPSSFSSSASYVITKSRNRGVNFTVKVFRCSFKGFSSQSSVSSVFSFQEFFPLNVSNFYCLLHWYTQFYFLNIKKILQGFAKIVSTYTKLRFNFFYFSLLTSFSFQR